jgi:hypothetical protein
MPAPNTTNHMCLRHTRPGFPLAEIQETHRHILLQCLSKRMLRPGEMNDFDTEYLASTDDGQVVFRVHFYKFFKH